MSFLRKKVIIYLEPYLKNQLVPLIEPLVSDDSILYEARSSFRKAENFLVFNMDARELVIRKTLEVLG